MSLYTVKTNEKITYTEKNSVFISYSFFVSSVEEVKAAISSVEKEHPDATHVVWAYSLYEYSQQRYTDAGEPQGTAGLPVMNIIKMKELLNTLVIVVRYFGGILLGAGGLTRAYAKSATLALDASGRCSLENVVTFECSFNYDRLKTINKFLSKYSAKTESTDYSEKVRIRAKLPEKSFVSFKNDCSDLFYSDFEIKELSTILSRI